MANNNYNVIVSATVDPKSLEASIKAQNDKNVIIVKAQIDPKFKQQFDSVMSDIQSKAKSIDKIKFSETGNKAIVDYTNSLNQAVKATITMGKELKVSETVTQNLAKDAKELARAYQNAEKFLAKSKNMDQKNPDVRAAMGTAGQIKSAVSDGDISKVRQLNDQLAIQKSALAGAKSGLDSWSAGIKNSIKQTIEYSLSIGLVYGALNQLKEGIQYVIDLNKELVNIQLVNGDSPEQVAKLASEYNNLAKQLGVTTLEIAKGSLEFIRQGKTAEETATLIRNSTMMSKLGNMEATESSEALTSIMNGFKMSVDETGTALDKLLAIDNSAATSIKELSTAMRYSSNSAAQVGVDFDHLAAYIGTVSSVTRLSAETIGQAYKTIFARMTSIKNLKAFDEEGEDVSKVETSLKRVGIHLRDANGQFRDMQDVLTDIGNNWNNINKEDQLYIAEQIAGVRQKETFLVLMNNQLEMQKQLTAETKSTGLATERYEIYLKGVEAAQNKLRASWEKLAQDTVSSGAVAGAYNFLAIILDIIDAVGGIPVVLGVAGAAYLAFTTSLSLETVIAALSVDSLAVSIVGLGAAVDTLLATNPVGWAILAVGAIVMIANAIPTLQERLDKLNKSIEEHQSNISGFRNQAKEAKDLSDQYSKLSDEYKKTGVASQEYYDVQNKLKDLIPELNGHYDEQGNFLIENKKQLDDVTKAIYDKIAAEKADMQNDIDSSANIRGNQLESAFSNRRGNRLNQSTPQIEALQENYKSILDESKVAFSQMGDEAKQAFIDSLDSPELINIFNDLWKKLIVDNQSPQYWELATQNAKEKGSEIAEATYEGFSETLKSLANSSSTIDDLISKSNSSEGLSLSEAAQIPPEYLDALTLVGDKLTVNIDKLKELQLEQAATALSAIQMAEVQGQATEQQVAIVQMQYNKLLEDSQNAFGAFNQTAWDYDALLWQISNDAIAAGYNTFTDLQGQALTSAQSIHDFMASSDAAFNSFVQQAAIATGQTVTQVMQQANAMAVQTYNSTVAMLNSLGGTMEGMYAKAGYLASGGSMAPMAAPNIFSTPAPIRSSGGGGGGGGGGGESKAEKKAREQAEKAKKIEQEINDARKEAIDDLKDQLSLYKDITSEKKKALDIDADEREYAQDVEDKNKEILKVQTELNALQFDNSEEAAARRLELQDQLSGLNQDLEDINYDQSVEMQKNALDADYAAFETQISAAIKAVEDISASSLGGFANQLAEILQNISLSVPQFHDGAKAGVVGKNSVSMKSNEVFAKLMAGEVVSSEGQIDKFMSRTLPQMIEGASTMNGGNMEFNMPVQIFGNVDKNSLPDLKKFIEAAVKQMNDNMANRGYSRRADQFGN